MFSTLLFTLVTFLDSFHLTHVFLEVLCPILDITFLPLPYQGWVDLKSPWGKMEQLTKYFNLYQLPAVSIGHASSQDSLRCKRVLVMSPLSPHSQQCTYHCREKYVVLLDFELQIVHNRRVSRSQGCSDYLRMTHCCLLWKVETHQRCGSRVSNCTSLSS